MTYVSVPAADGVAEAIVALPAPHPDGRTYPGVLFFMDAIGLRPQIEQMTQRIADWGYVVLAPNFFYRTGTVTDIAPKGDLHDPAVRERFWATVGPHRAALTTVLADADTAAYVAALRARAEVAPGPMGTLGFCMGARLATRAAGHHPDDIAAVACFHGGGLVTDAADSPHLSLSNARAEFVYGHADNDRSNPPAAIAALGDALAAAGLTATNEVYAGAQHGYTMADTPMYDRDAAERAFAALKALFARTLTP